MSRIDLHIHSNASDGRYSPEEIVARAAARGLEIIALADHDTLSGIARALSAARSFPGLRVIPAVEISTDVPAGEVHVLGYYIDYNDGGLGSLFERMRDSRRERAQQMIDKLANLGLPVEWRRVQEIAGSGSVGRPHIALAMLEKGYIGSVREAFVRYLGHGGPAYVAWAKMTPQRAVERVVEAGGLPVLAHPLTASDPEALTGVLKKAGLVGLEAYYDGYSQEEKNGLVALAKRHCLITTGGSDYHGLDDSAETMLGGVEVPRAPVAELIRLAERRGLSSPVEKRQ